MKFLSFSLPDGDQNNAISDFYSKSSRLSRSPRNANVDAAIKPFICSLSDNFLYFSSIFYSLLQWTIFYTVRLLNKYDKYMRVQLNTTTVLNNLDKYRIFQQINSETLHSRKGF